MTRKPRNKKLKQRVRDRMAWSGEKYVVARAHVATKFPVAKGTEPKVLHLYFCREEGPSHERRDALVEAQIPFFLRDLDRDDIAWEETEALGIDGIPNIAVCAGRDLLVEPADVKMPVSTLRKIHASAYFDHELMRWAVPRELALDAGFEIGRPIDRSDERPEDYLDEGVDVNSLSEMLDAYAYSHDLKTVLDAVGYVAPVLKLERAELIEELFCDGEVSGMDIARHLPRKAVDQLSLPLGVDIVGNLPRVRERLAKAIEARYRRKST